MKTMEQWKEEAEECDRVHKIHMANMDHHVVACRYFAVPGVIAMLVAMCIDTAPLTSCPTKASELTMLLGGVVAMFGFSMLMLTPSRKWPWSPRVDYPGEK